MTEEVQIVRGKKGNSIRDVGQRKNRMSNQKKEGRERVQLNFVTLDAVYIMLMYVLMMLQAPEHLVCTPLVVIQTLNACSVNRNHEAIVALAETYCLEK